MPGFKTITTVVPPLLAAAGTSAAPFQRRGLDQVVSQCNHNFACVSSVSPLTCRAPTTETNPRGYGYIIVTPLTMVHTSGTPTLSKSSTVLVPRPLSVRSTFLSVELECSPLLFFQS